MLEQSDLIQDAAKSYGYRLISTEFNKVIDKCDAKEKEILSNIYRLYAVSQIINDSGFYLRHELMEPTTINKLHDYHGKLCSDLATIALDLVDVFGISNELLNVPIAMNWVKYNSFDNNGEVNANWL